jgi:hypothetical protein
MADIPSPKEIDFQLFIHIGTISKILQKHGLITATEYDKLYAETEKEVIKRIKGSESDG